MASPEQTDEAFQRILAENNLTDTSFQELVETVDHEVREDEPAVSSMSKSGLAPNSPNGRDFC